MTEVGHVIQITPVALMSEVILKNKDCWKSELELKAEALERLDQLEASGAPIRISASTTESVMSGAMDMVIGRGLIKAREGLYKAEADAEVILAYYANSIAHWQKASHI